ncbi:MAG TPA: aminotransferase class V-fold PLP-dependent enzyme [Steroidobacteraceae bacterium]|nr:aminotransferase class V-fold PLP-dependent enzyme [Steroidobacteraceae bacterium]
MAPPISRRTLLGVLGTAAALGPVANAQTYTPQGVPPIDRYRWAWARAQLVLEPGLTWLDTASFGPTLRAVLVRTYRQLEEQSLDFRSFEALNGAGSAGERSVLAAAASFLGCDAGELVLTDGARTGLALVAAGLDLQRDDEVLVSMHDHAAAVYPWIAQARRRGIRVVEAPATAASTATPEAIVQQFERSLTPRTRVACLAHIQDCDGTVLPIRELCAVARSRGVFTVVDGALASGHVDFRLADLGCDAYATGVDRWLNGPLDAGLLYVRRDAQARVWPALPDRADGWNGTDRFNAALPVPPFEYAAATRFGNARVRRGASVAAIPLAFEFQDAISRPLVYGRIRELGSQLRSGLQRIAGVDVVTPPHFSLNAGILSVRLPGRDPGEIVERIAREDRIVLGRVTHGAGFDAIRISVHPTNDAIDVDRAVAAVQRHV